MLWNYSGGDDGDEGEERRETQRRRCDANLEEKKSKGIRGKHRSEDEATASTGLVVLAEDAEMSSGVGLAVSWWSGNAEAVMSFCGG